MKIKITSLLLEQIVRMIQAEIKIEGGERRVYFKLYACTTLHSKLGLVQLEKENYIHMPAESHPSLKDFPAGEIRKISNSVRKCLFESLANLSLKFEIDPKVFLAALPQGNLWFAKDGDIFFQAESEDEYKLIGTYSEYEPTEIGKWITVPVALGGYRPKSFLHRKHGGMSYFETKTDQHEDGFPKLDFASHVG